MLPSKQVVEQFGVKRDHPRRMARSYCIGIIANPRADCSKSAASAITAEACVGGDRHDRPSGQTGSTIRQIIARRLRVTDHRWIAAIFPARRITLKPTRDDLACIVCEVAPMWLGSDAKFG